MTDPAETLAARIERFEQSADPELIWDPAALAEAEQAMRACAGDRSDAATWRLIGILHLARYRLDQRITTDAAVAGAFFAAVAVVDPGRLPEKLRGSKVPPGESAGTWAGLVEEVFGHVDPATYRHVGLLIHALVRRAVAHPTVESADRLERLLLQQAMRSADPSWAPGALALLGGGLVRLYSATGQRELIDDAVHVLFRAALGAPGEAAVRGELAAALALAAPDDADLVRGYLAAAESAPGGQDRSQALLTLVDLTQARAARSCLDDDLLAFIRVGQCALDFWHEQWAHPGVLAPYAAGLVEWYVVTGDERSLEAGQEMLDALATPGETAQRLGTDPLVRLRLLSERRWRRYGATGDPADLDTAVEAMREAAGLAPPGHFERGLLLWNLANALLRRCIVGGGDPAEPIAAARTALSAHPADDPDRPRALLLLAQALERDLTREHAEEAVAALREAVAGGEGQALCAEAYGLLAKILLRRATQSGVAQPHATPAGGTQPGDAAEPGGDLRSAAGLETDDLEEAVLAARQGLELAAKSSRDQAPAQRLLSEALLARFSARRDARDLGEALTLARDGDAGLLTRLSAVLDGPGPLPVDEQLAQAATDLALSVPDENAALKLLRYAERQFEAAGERGAFLLDVALRLAEPGRLATANTVLSRASAAFAEAGRRSQVADALSRQAANHEELGELDRALEAYERSADAYRSLGDVRSEALQTSSMGAVHLRAGDPARAVDHHLRAVSLCADAGLAAEEAAHQVRAVDAYLTAGDPGAALACASRARELYLSLGDTAAAANVLIPAARAAVDQGDLTAAVERIAACAMELEAAGAWEDACRALDAHAVLLAGHGHRLQAAACEARLVEIVRRRGQRREPADEWHRIARRRHAGGDPAGARAAFELAEREYESIGHHDGSGSVRYHLGVLAYTEDDLERALEEFQAAGETFARLRATAKEATALTMRASCLAALDRLDDALAELERALELAAVEGDLDALFTATLHRAVLAARLGEFEEAGERLYTALGLAAADPLKEGVVRDRLAGLAARTGDLRTQVEALELAAAHFREGGQARLAAITSIKLGFALEERGEFRRARAALEEGLAGLETGLRPGEAPFEVIAATAATAGGMDAALLARVAAVQLTLGDVARARATLAEAVTALRSGGEERADAVEDLETRLRIEEAEAAADPRLARALAEQALAQLDQAPADEGQALASADTHAMNGRGPATAPADAAGRQSLLLAKLSACCRRLGEPAAAYGYAARGCELRDDRIAEHLLNLGAAAGELGRAEEAIGHFTKAVESSRDTGSVLPVQLVHALSELGRALAGQARWREAARAYDEGLALTASPIWRALRAPLLSGRAGLHLKLGELDEAAAAFREALAINEELGGRDELGSDHADLGLVHLLRGERDRARPLLERALDIERANGDERGIVLALIMLARLEEPALAAAYREEAGRTAAGRDEGAWAHLRETAGRREETGRAAVFLEEAVAVAGRIGFEAGEAIALGGLGALDLATGDHARAHRRLSTAIGLLEELGHEPELRIAHHHRAAATEHLGDLSGALADAGRAWELGHAPALDRAIRLAVRLGRGTAAWTHVEQANARTLIAQLGHDGRPAPPGVQAELLEAEQRGLDDVRALASAARRTRDPAQAATLIRRAHAAQTGVEALWRRMEPTAPDYVAMRRGTSPGKPDLDALAAPARPTGGSGAHQETGPLSENAARSVVGGQVTGLLGFHVGEDTVTVLAHRTGWAEPRAFPTTAGRDLLADFTRTIDGERPDLLDVAGRRHRLGVWRHLADLLLSDALDALGDDVDLLHLFPHRELRRVPLHALDPGGRLLLERCPVTYAPSAAVLARLSRRPPAEDGRSPVLALSPRADARTEPADAAGEPFVWGIRLALLPAEARSVLLPLWPVAPEITQALMRDFQARLRAGANTAQALRGAVLELRELYGTTEPDLWAAYVLVGLAD
ncbi:tetratricopeptide repeat protein [Nonomuraea sp. H19]|uniref:tetratricopeptide repeat protein n=1 Tax=Nonomuraea sp. H19 TaxID=3452206 RepID=UPI003F89E775